MNKNFTDEAWSDYQYWIENDKKQLKRINLLVKDIDRNPYDEDNAKAPGAGQRPEPA
jgi:toxin YoeB